MVHVIGTELNGLAGRATRSQRAIRRDERLASGSSRHPRRATASVLSSHNSLFDHLSVNMRAKWRKKRMRRLRRKRRKMRARSK
ncbi:unnamed protein product [Jaminaea pallidilutea]